MNERVVEGSVPVTWENRWTLVLPDGPAPARGFPVVVALHGFGDDRARFLERLAPLRGGAFALLVPDAPFPVEMRPRDGAAEHRVGYAWYQYSGDRVALSQTLAREGERLLRLVDDVAGAQPIDTQRAWLLGYSQGGYVAGVLALARRDRFRGLVAIACRVKTEEVETSLAGARGFPVLIVHGRGDKAVALAPQEAAAATLLRHGAAVDWHLHDGGHGLGESVARAIRAWLDARV